MSSKGKRPMRALTAGDKIEAIQRVNDGESKASVARDIGVPESTLRGWCKNEDKLRYMSSRRSSPDTDTSDAEPAKRARTESPPAPASPPAAAPPPAPPAEPVELTTRRDPVPAAPPRRPDSGATASMSAISPLSGLAHLAPQLSHAHTLGLSFNEIATNLSLLAQLNPALSLGAAPARALRSVRSPKPAPPAAALNLSDKRKHHDHYSHRAKPKDPVDDTLWYWLKTQQAMLDLTQAQATPAPPAPAPAAPAAHDYNRNSWLWQYYKQFGGALPPPDDKLRAAAQVPRDKTSENILYSQLVKGNKSEEGRASPAGEGARGAGGDAARSPAAEHREGAGAEGRGGAKARTVLDSLLFHNNNNTLAAPGGGEGDAREALEHGDKFLAWLEASGDPAVTRMHVHQLRALLHNLRARRAPPVAPPLAAPRK